MNKLSVREQDLLQRVDENEALRPQFFRKINGTKWFDDLYKKGYFNPENIPKPVPAKEEGYVSIPYWPAIDYLVKTSDKLGLEENKEYASNFLDILKKVTKYAIRHDISNYRTWWRFSEIIQNIPPAIIKLDDVEIVEYWLDDKFERGLVAEEIGQKWIHQLLESNNIFSLPLALRLLSYLFKVVLNERKLGKSVDREPSLRFDYYYADNVTKKIANLAGIKLGQEAVLIFDEQLKFILDELKNDSWSAVWRPSIEEHEQNKCREDAKDILVNAYRDSLRGYISSKPDDAYEYIKGMLSGDYPTIHRLAVLTISDNFRLCNDLLDTLLDAKYLGDNYRHEMWHLLNRNYQQFSESQKQKTLGLISKISRADKEGNIREGSTAYKKAIWLAAIRKHGVKEAELYKQNVEIAETEPDHPDFSSYTSTSWVGHESPISLEDLQALPIEQLLDVLKSHNDSDGFREPGIEGLSKTFKQLVMVAPLRYYDQLGKFTNLNLAYIYEIIEAFRDLWTKKSQLPWDDIWPCLLGFCSTVIGQDRFWDQENKKDRASFVANRYWIVGGIGLLLEAGTKSDDHAFSEKYLDAAEAIITRLLNREKGNEYNDDSDAVSISINSPRGRCLEALVNLTLRSCRLSDSKNNKDHSKVWAHFQPFYDAELERAYTEKPEYEFATLVANYLPNFLYMSKEWVLDNLNRIFDQNDYLKWLCAMQGYSYVGTVYQEIYQYLKEHGDCLKVLNDKNIKDGVRDKIIQNIAVAYIENFEKLTVEDSLIYTLISRNNHEELSHLIWFIWTLRKKGNENLKNKVYELWPKILENIDLSTREGKRMASQLCHWAIFVDKIDNARNELLLAIAPYADETHNSYELLKSIAGISQTQPFEAHVIWMKMLEGATQDYPEEAVRQLLANLINQGHEGLRKAKEVVSEYVKNGNDRPATWLQEINSGS